MNTLNLATFLSDSFKTVGVRFDGTNTTLYTYKIPKDWELKEEDRIVVDSPRGGLVCVSVVRVDGEGRPTDFDPLDRKIKWKWAVSQIDMSEYQARLDAEKQLEGFYRLAAAEKQRKQVKEEVLGSLSTEQAKVFEDLLTKI